MATSPTNLRGSHPFRAGLTEEVQREGNPRTVLILNIFVADSVSRARLPAAATAAPVDEGRAGLMEAIRLAGGSNRAG